ncbi:MAG: helicase-related protein [Myxococcota bacterium]|nr:helicase-related protein [Myxococcota bacterium]
MARLSELIDLDGRSHITALLGPTNTGKTHRAIERMMTHGSGIIGLPLRLLAREVYERIKERVGPERAALVTGEERIVPPGARYFAATVESMPLTRPVAFVAVDEIQLATHRQRGHVFTDRLLNARGVKETWFLGSDTMIPIIEQLVPTAEIRTFQRLSTLRYSGVSRLTALPPRSAVVAFSAAHVYELAERLRAARGGTAVVLGALSPRTRNAQVEMYQSGEVRYIVSTDAIGMGLNLDIHHLALGAISKYDGRTHRPLQADELGQIAGRAGRNRRDGTFGITARCAANTGGLDAGIIDAVEQQRFSPVRRIFYRNSDLDFSSPTALQDALDARPPRRIMMPARNATDRETLDRLLADPRIRDRAARTDELMLLWEVSRIPDFRGILVDSHVTLVRQLYLQLSDHGQLDADFISRRLTRLSRTDGGMEELMTRIAFIRTWNFIANRPDWMPDAAGWLGRARQIEDRLSDALHDLLTSRFVDTRAVVLVDHLRDGLSLEAELKDGEVRAAGVLLGRLEGLAFVAEESDTALGSRAIVRAARQALAETLSQRIRATIDAPHALIVLDGAHLMVDDVLLARLLPGSDPRSPQLHIPHNDLLTPAWRSALRKRAQRWLCDELARLDAPLLPEPSMSPAAIGLLYQLKEVGGFLPRAVLAEPISRLTDLDRKGLRRLGVRLGFHTVYSMKMLKPVNRKGVVGLLAVRHGSTPPPPSGGAVSCALAGPRGFYTAIGFAPLGSRAVRVDMLERLSAHLRAVTRRGSAPLPTEASSWVGCSIEELIGVCRALGYTVTGADTPRIRRAHQRRRSR